MKCKKCNKQAVFHITELTNSKPVEHHLCEEHAREYLSGSSQEAESVGQLAVALSQGNIPGNIQEQIQAKPSVGGVADELKELDLQTCPICGMSFYDFRQIGKLGCPNDYSFFSQQLDDLLMNIHGAVEHTGKVPKDFDIASALQSKKTLLIKLRRELDDAVQYEDYESAAKLRDKIKNIETQEIKTVPNEKTELPVPSLPKTLPALCEWLKGGETWEGIVISSRIRLARNLAGFPFMSQITESYRQAIRDTVFEAAATALDSKKFYAVEVNEIPLLDQHYLLERQLISKELLDSKGTRAVLFEKHEKFAVMVNEEDHLRLCAMTGGFHVEKSWKRLRELEEQLAAPLHFVFHPKYGFQTACPTNAGTGMRVSVMLHLPALVITKDIDKVFRALQKVNLAVRGLYGEGTQPIGDFFQISNQATLGKTEDEIIERVVNFVPQIIEYEHQAREFLLKERRDFLLDRCSRALGVLQTARTISTMETMHHLSSLRLGVNTNLLDAPTAAAINELFLNMQPAHLQKHYGKDFSQPERDIARADFIRKSLR
jgi:protein arginine kinase